MPDATAVYLPQPPTPASYARSYDQRQTAEFLSHLLDPTTGCLEMRVFKAQFSKGGFVQPCDARFSQTLAGWYDSPDLLAVDAMRLKSVSAYVTINPVTPDLLARSYNRLIKSQHATSDNDIVCIRWLYIDIDPVRPADISSTDAELQAALSRRDSILSDDRDMRASALWGCSGNGAWILARLPDLPNTVASKRAVALALKDLSKRYSDDRVKIDVSTKNPSRVMCLPGTTKCKGTSIPNRPHRVVTFDGCGEQLQSNAYKLTIVGGSHNGAPAA